MIGFGNKTHTCRSSVFTIARSSQNFWRDRWETQACKGSRAHGSIQNMICIQMINTTVHPHTHPHTTYIRTHVDGREIGHIRRTPQCPPLRKILYRPNALLSENTCVYSIGTHIYVYIYHAKGEKEN